MSDEMWFNLWQKRLWPYHELQPGDDLYWYESPTKAIVWKTRVVQVEAFPYQALSEALKVMERRFGVKIDRLQPYLHGKPEEGFCLAYRVEALESLFLPKPPSISKFNQQGWERGTRPEVAAWLGISGSG
jgi:hypothetical protein